MMSATLQSNHTHAILAKTYPLPEPPLTGRCQCLNSVKYEITKAPQSLNACYCKECQRQSGSAFALTLVVPSDGLKIDARSAIFLRHFERKTESGGVRGGFFCSQCGVRLWHFDPAKPEWASVKAGTLCSELDFRSAQHIWTKRTLKGLHVPEDAEAYEEEPPDGPV